MSLECSECERDLRGGHDPFCSRSKGWTKCNLPWTYYGDWKDLPEPPNLNKEEKEAFGKTVSQAYKELEKFYKGCKPAEYDKITKTKEFKTAQRKYKKFADEVCEWTKTHPLWLEYQEEIKAYDKKIGQKSFCGRELNQPGTLIEVRVGKELQHLLIGDINKLGGVCDDCMNFDKDAVVVRYKVLYGCEL